MLGPGRGPLQKGPVADFGAELSVRVASGLSASKNNTSVIAVENRPSYVSKDAVRGWAEKSIA